MKLFTVEPCAVRHRRRARPRSTSNDVAGQQVQFDLSPVQPVQLATNGAGPVRLLRALIRAGLDERDLLAAAQLAVGLDEAERDVRETVAMDAALVFQLDQEARERHEEEVAA
jgi:hypothetical protein